MIVLFLLALGACGDHPAPRPSPTTSPTPSSAARPRVVGYFTDWGVYGRNFQVKDIETSGSAGRLTDLVYAFGKVDGGRCAVGDAWADFQKPIAAADSVDGAADDTTAAGLKGSFGQLVKLKARNPGLRLLWSFGGWSGSGGFSAAARDPDAFARSCHALLTDKRWPGLFDGIDVDWEYPNACGLSCDTSGRDALPAMLAALRRAFGANALVAAAVPGDADKLAKTDYAAAAKSADWLGAMTYDYFGTGADGGDDAGDRQHTAAHSALTAYAGIPRTDATVTGTVDELLKLGVPADRVLLGVGFYGRGWTGVTSDRPGGAATGPATGKYEKGLEDYDVLAPRCPPTGTAGGTAYARCGSQWWSYDTPATIRAKMAYARSKGLAGAFAWELSGDTAKGELVSAMAGGLDTAGPA